MRTGDTTLQHRYRDQDLGVGRLDSLIAGVCRVEAPSHPVPRTPPIIHSSIHRNTIAGLVTGDGDTHSLLRTPVWAPGGHGNKRSNTHYKVCINK